MCICGKENHLPCLDCEPEEHKRYMEWSAKLPGPRYDRGWNQPMGAEFQYHEDPRISGDRYIPCSLLRRRDGNQVLSLISASVFLNNLTAGVHSR